MDLHEIFEVPRPLKDIGAQPFLFLKQRDEPSRYCRCRFRIDTNITAKLAQHLQKTESWNKGHENYLPVKHAVICDACAYNMSVDEYIKAFRKHYPISDSEPVITTTKDIVLGPDSRNIFKRMKMSKHERSVDLAPKRLNRCPLRELSLPF